MDFFILNATLCAVLIFHKEQPVIRKRYMFGILFLALGLSLISSIIEFKPHPGSYGLKYIMENAGNIINGSFENIFWISRSFVAMSFFSHYSIILEPM